MNFKKLSRSLVCLLLVACMLVAVSPVRANATGLVESVTAVAVSNPLALLGTVIVGLGVVAVADHYDVFDTVVRDCEAWMRENTDFFTTDGVYVAERTYGQYKYYAISESFLQAVRNFIFESETVKEVVVPTAGMTQGVGVSIDDDAGCSWASALDISGLAKAAPVGSRLLLAGNKSTISACTFFYGLKKVNDTFFGKDVLAPTSSPDLGLFTSRSFPVGYFVEGFSTTVNFSASSYASCFMSYEDALDVFLLWKNSQLSSCPTNLYYLTDSAHLSVGQMGSKSCIYLRGIEYIDISTGAVKEGSQTFLSLTGYSSYVYPFMPSEFYLEDVVSVESDLALTVNGVATSDKTLSEGYADWTTGAITLPGSTTIPNQDEKDKYYPIDFPPDISDVFDMTQSEAQGGTKSETDSNAGTNSDPVTGTNLKSWLQSLKDNLAQWFSRLTLHVSNIYDSIVNGFASLVSALADLPALIAGIFRTLAAHFKSIFLLGTLLEVLGEFLQALFGWLPESMFMVLMLTFGVAIFYKFIGR